MVGEFANALDVFTNMLIIITLNGAVIADYLKVVLGHGIVNKSLNSFTKCDLLFDLVGALGFRMIHHQSSCLPPIPLKKREANTHQRLVISLGGLRIHDPTIPGLVISMVFLYR